MCDKSKLLIILLFALFQACTAQVPSDKPSVNNPDFDKRLESLLSFSVPLLGTEELASQPEEYVILDAREKEEYEVGHIPGAIYVGYNKFNFSSLEGIEKKHPVVVYCSVGYRSEKIGKKLMKKGYTSVYNLYGSIFEWVNDGYKIIDRNGQKTETIHTYNKNWSKWVDNEEYEKVW